MSNTFLRKYGTGISTNTAYVIRIPVIKRAVVDYAVSADWTPVAGDVKITKDGGATANIATLPVAVTYGNGALWEFIFSATEMQAATIVVTIVDAATKAVEDQAFVIETYGNASAMYQWDMSLGNLPANVTQLLGTAWLTPGTAGTPDVNVKLWNALTTVALPLVPTVAGRTLDVSTGGEAGLDWANIGSPTTVVALTGTTIAVTQKVDVDTIKTNAVVNGGTITFPTGATLASTTNITAGTVTTATNVTTVNGLAAGVITAASIAADAITAAKIADGAIDTATFASGTTIPRVTLADTLTTYTGNTPQTGDNYARLGAPAGASIAADLAEIEAETDGIAAIPTSNPSAASIATAIWQDLLAGSDFGTAGSIGKLLKDDIDAAISSRSTYAGGDTSGVTTLLTRIPGVVQPQTGDSYARLGAPTGASIAADLAEIEGETDGIATLFTTQMTESYNTDGAAPTPAQALMGILQRVTEFAISGTSITVKKLDGSTTAMVLTMDSSSAPTSSTRTS